ncbi:hypothetical protein V2J94_28940 [Streptomyces sp. DSM 41524]|uniref:Integral membrane protein n=1 Tax=Streptomyces asiaticus subsp. ignotus TaxID=3098222 RepID=A0ABU7Q3D5_9ACTN|nr:hypothetical protein [Streptomyces sp. DSM 41524]
MSGTESRDPSARMRGLAARAAAWPVRALATALLIVVLVQLLGGHLFAVPRAGVWLLSILPDPYLRGVVVCWLLAVGGALLFFCGTRLGAYGRGHHTEPAGGSGDPSPARQRRRPVLTWVTVVTGAVLAAGALVPAAVIALGAAIGTDTMADLPPRDRVLLCASGLVGGLPPVEFARRVHRHARRRIAPVLSSPDDLGEQPYVLYLRPFSFDRTGYAMAPSYGRGSGLPVGRTLNVESLLASTTTFEELTAQKFSRFGKVIAVGRPGERLPFAGATRFYLPLEGWKPVVSDLIRRARLVLIVAGTSPGTLWEFTEAVRLLPASRLLLLIQDDQEGYDRFRRAVPTAFAERAGELGRSGAEPPEAPALPPYPPLHRPDRATTLPILQGIVHFDGAWSTEFERLDPTLVPARRRWSWVSYHLDRFVERLELRHPKTAADSRRTPRRPAVGWVVHGVFVIVVLMTVGLAALGIAIAVGVEIRTELSTMGRIGMALCSWWAALLGGALWRPLRRWAREHTTALLRSPAEIGPAPYVLFPRPRPEEPALYLHSPVRQGVNDFISPWLEFTVEEELAKTFAPLGRLIATGEPGEQGGLPGAVRLYLPPEGWRRALSEAISRAHLVVLVAGTGAEALWALTEALRVLPPARLLVLVRADPESYEAFRRAASEAFAERADDMKRSHGAAYQPPRFPRYPSGERGAAWRRGAPVRGVMRFTDDGNPVFLPFTPSPASNDSPRLELRQWIQSQLGPVREAPKDRTP